MVFYCLNNVQYANPNILTIILQCWRIAVLKKKTNADYNNNIVVYYVYLTIVKI